MTFLETNIKQRRNRNAYTIHLNVSSVPYRVNINFQKSEEIFDIILLRS